MTTPLFVDVSQAQIADEEVTAVNARDLHDFLDVGRDFSNWIKDRIKAYGFIKNVDFIVVQNLTSPNLARSKSRARSIIDYTISLDMAKELCMIEKTEKGRQCRRYFIACEKQLRMSTDKLHYKLAEAEMAVKQVTDVASFHGRGLRQTGRFDKPAAIARRDDLMRQIQPLLPFIDPQ